MNRQYVLYTSILNPVLPVPRIYSVAKDMNCYITEDLGSSRLDSLLHSASKAEQTELLWEATQMLIRFHEQGRNLIALKNVELLTLDEAQLRQFIHYFLDSFVDLFDLNSHLNEAAKDEIEGIVSHCAALRHTGFITCDFQPRNIMSYSGRLHLIDFQDGRLGNLLYDLVSLWFSGSCSADQDMLDELTRRLLIDSNFYESETTFKQDLFYFAILRRLRSLGTYGQLGKKENKPAFIAKIPETLNQLILLSRAVSNFMNIENLQSFFQKTQALFPVLDRQVIQTGKPYQ